MFTLAANEKIGQYLTKRIEERFQSHREFCREYLKDIGDDVGNEQLQKMSNRLSQILKGKKEIQLYDLPVFCRLLEISCEDILSAGKSHVPSSARLTNYVVAFSKDERIWEKYINGKDSPITCAAEFKENGIEYAAKIENWEHSPILHADEYGKTIIDYALEAENYALLKYLMDKKYIWFVGTEEKNYFTGFGAGTSIEKALLPYPGNWNVLDVQLKMRDELRTHMAALAIQHKDIGMLKQLRAREIPTLYQLSYYSSRPDECGKYRNELLMEELTHADASVLEFFSDEFEITNRFGSTNRFTFPFLGELIDRLLQKKVEFVEYMLEDAIQHNQYVYDQLIALLSNAVQFYRQLNYDLTSVAVQDNLAKNILRDIYFYSEGSLVSYFALLPNSKRGLQSNIIRVNTESSNTMINRRISELNGLYDAIHQITPDFEGEADNEAF